MIAWVVRRVAASIAIIWAVVTLTFFVIHAARGSPFLPEQSQSVSPETLDRLRRQFGLDRSLPEQYVLYLRNLARGELGESFVLRRPVADALADAMPHTFFLALAALLIDFTAGLALGIY
ncbi:MAG: ABC transporter permease, partial [Gemmatimonadetes bacterium]